MAYLSEYTQKVLSKKRKAYESEFTKRTTNNIDLPQKTKSYETNKNKSILKTVGSTVGDVATNVGKGFLHGVEGMVDLGRYGVANVADLIGADKYADDVRERAKQDTTSVILKPANDLYNKNSALKENGIVENVSQGIGYIGALVGSGKLMPTKLQSVNLGNKIPTGSKIGNAASNILGRFDLPTTTLLNSMGSGMTEAYNEGATNGQALTYGAMSGLVESFSEAMFSGLGKSFGKMYGDGALDDIVIGKLTNKISNKTIKTLAQSGLKATGEGIEEIVSGLGSAFAKKLTYMNKESVGKLINDEKLLDSFVVGTLTSMVAQTPGTLDSIKNKTDYVVKNNTPNESQPVAPIKSPNINKNSQYNIDTQEKTNYSVQPKTSEIDNTTRFSANKYFKTDNEQMNQTLDILDKIKEQRSTKDSKLEIEFNDEVPANGMHITDGNNRKIVINPKSDNYLEQVFIHELAHDFENQTTYKELSDYVQSIAKQDGTYENARQSLTDAYEQFYEKNGLDFSEVDMDVETTNDMLAKVLGNQEYLNRLAGEKPSLFKKVYDYIKDVIFGGNLKDLGNRIQSHRELSNIKNMFETAYNDYYVKVDNKTEYLLSKNALKEVLDVVNQTRAQAEISNTQFVKLKDNTIKSLINYGIKDLPMLERAGHVRENILTEEEAKKLGFSTKNKHFHGLGVKNYLEIIDAMDNPISVYQYTNKGKYNENNFIVVTPIEINGNKSIVPVEINQKGQYNSVEIDFNKIKSSYLETKSNYLNKLLNEGKIKEIFTQSSAEQTSLDANNISQKDNKVNSDTSSTKYSIPLQKNYSSDGGYDGKSMSNRAKEAYSDGEKPLSKWTKKEIISNIMFNNNSIDENLLNKLTHTELINNFLYQSSWHHTGAFYNETNFYELDSERIENLINDDIQSIIDERVPKQKKALSEQEKIARAEQNKLGKEIIDNSKDTYLKYLLIKEMKIPGYKSSKSIFDSIYNNKIDKIYEEAKRMFKEREQNKIEAWKRLPEDHYRKEYVELFNNDIEEYFKKEYLNKNLNLHSKEYQKIKGHYNRINEKNVKELYNVLNKDIRYSQNENNWNEYLDKNWDLDKNKTKTKLNDIKIPTAKDIKNLQTKAIAPIKETVKNREDLIQISKLTKNDANTTPNIPIKEGINKIGDGRSKFWNNIDNKTDMLNETQKESILENEDVKYYDKITNKEDLEKAHNRLRKGGASETLTWFNKNAKDCDSTDVAEGWILLKQYADSGNADGMVEVAKKMREIGTKAGQTVQAFNIMERMTPEGMVKYAQSELTEAYNQMIKNKTQSWIEEHRKDFDLKPDEVQFILDNMKEVSQMKDGYDKRVKLAEIQKIMTDKLPYDGSKVIKSWMRISMLFNTKTQVRNVVGNAIIAPVNYFSDMFSSYADKMIAKKTNVRTTGKINVKATLKGFKEGAYQATNDYKKGINTKDMEGNRFEIGEGKSFNDKTLIGKSLNRVEGLLNYVMDAGDRMFSQSSFENSLQNQLLLNNTTEITQEMVDIARTESLQRTWNDNNEYTKFVLNIRKGMNKLNVGGYGLGDVLIPFAKTPANLTKAIVDYSPLGFVKALKEGIYLNRSLTNGQYNAKMQHQFVQDLGKATAGSILYILGIALAKAGITTGESDEDKDTKNFLEKTLGVSSYSVKIGSKSFTYDWAQPLAAPLSITANIVNSKKNKDTALLEAIVSNLDTASSILLEQSFLKGIQEVLNSNGKVVDGMIKQVLDLPARAIPTFSKHIADMVDGTQRTTYEYNSKLKTSVNSVKTKIPFLSKTLPASVDTMGRDIEKYGGNNNLFNVFLNPANVNVGKLNKSAEEIYRVYKQVGDKSIMPRVAPYYLNNKDEKIILTAKQKGEFQKISGKIVNENIGKLLSENTYTKLNEVDKSDIIKNIVDYSYNKAKEEVLGIETSKTYNKINKYVNDGGKVYDYYLNKDEINYSYENPDKYLVYRSITKDFKQITNIMKSISDIKADEDFNGKTISGSRRQKVFDYINNSDLGFEQRLILAKMEYPSYNEYNYEIINYLNNKKDISYEQEVKILRKLGFNVDSSGNISWN